MNKNNFNLTVGQELTEANGSYLWGARDGFAMESTDYMYLDVGEENVRNGNDQSDALEKPPKSI